MKIPPCLSREEIIRYAKLYNKDEGRKKDAPLEKCLMNRMPEAEKQGYMTYDDLIKIVKWKAPRGNRYPKQNKPGEVEKASKISFSTKSEQEKIHTLLKLRGVGWPMASVILHFAYRDKYPILDFRVMRAVGSSSTYYNFAKWCEYTKLCRKELEKHNKSKPKISMRELDRALWKYDEVKHKKKNSARWPRPC